jgi:hypothetical protein
MKIKYAVVSANNNSEYLDFWPYVAKAWKDLIGLEPILLYIDKEEPSAELSKHGKVFYLESIPEWSIVQQAQSIRFWAARLLDAPFIISDMDMLPISKKYYENGVSGIEDNGIVSYSSDVINYRWYKTNPQYPMCYLAGDPTSFINCLQLNDTDHKDFLRRLMKLNIRFGTDQKFFYNQSKVTTGYTLTHLSRGWIEEKYAVGRLDKAIWPKNGYKADGYIDCHLPRPMIDHLEMCNELFTKLNLLNN